MNDLLRQIDDFVRNLFGGTVDVARDRASWEGASAVERATFGKVFNAIEVGLFLVMIFGCAFIANATENQKVLYYVCGILWIVPFIAVAGLLARFRRSLFVRVRGAMNRFLGG
jgi:hypothetical protein